LNRFKEKCTCEDGKMDGKWIFHDRIGYYIGRWVAGQIVRLSLEHYSSEQACIEAIRGRFWTRRTLGVA